jgi:hypothetical protein
MLPVESLRQAPGDAFFDYCHYAYEPEIDPALKLHSLALFDRVLELAAAPAEWAALIRDLRTALGKDRTVWGVKRLGEEFHVELYFYNYGRLDPQVRPSKVLAAMAPHFDARLPDLDARRYFMFSIDVGPEAWSTRRLSGVHLYVHDVQERPTSLCYLVSESGVVLENHYAFYRPALELEALRFKVLDSAVVDFTRATVDDILLPDLLRAKSVCIANKPRADAVYYSGISVRQLIEFCAGFSYPAPLVDFLETNASALEHLQFDIGWDYRSGDKPIELVKSGFYGTF